MAERVDVARRLGAGGPREPFGTATATHPADGLVRAGATGALARCPYSAAQRALGASRRAAHALNSGSGPTPLAGNRIAGAVVEPATIAAGGVEPSSRLRQPW